MFVNNPSISQEFVHLSDVCSHIVQSPRYATTFNITGKPLNGYKKPTIVLTNAAAQALKRVYEQVKKDGFNLVVYDAYRPQAAVEDLKQWAKIGDNHTKHCYYPRLPTKKDLFVHHFIAAQSSHSRGSTVDVTLIAANKNIHTPQEKSIELSDGTKLTILDDGTVDMGTSFDFMDKASYSQSPLITPEQQAMRDYLARQMKLAGFRGCSNEWWHFTLEDEPFPAIYFDFCVE